MKTIPPELTARVLALMNSVALGNNGRADTTDIEAAVVLREAGYMVKMSDNQHPALRTNWTVSTRAAWEAEVRSMIDEVWA